jgi:hypothetical protein
MEHAGERPRAGITARTSQEGSARVGGRPATAVAGLGRSPLRRPSLRRKIIKNPRDHHRSLLGFDGSEAKPQRGLELVL